MLFGIEYKLSLDRSHHSKICNNASIKPFIIEIWPQSKHRQNKEYVAAVHGMLKSGLLQKETENQISKIVLSSSIFILSILLGWSFEGGKKNVF